MKRPIRSRKRQPGDAERVYAQAISDNIRLRRTSLGLTQTELALLADLHPSQVSEMEGGTIVPRLDTLVRIAAAMAISPSRLLVRRDTPENDRERAAESAAQMQRIRETIEARHSGDRSPKPRVGFAAAAGGYGKMGMVSVSDDRRTIQCHVCGNWYRALPQHIKVHGFDAASYKERYELNRRASLWAPETQSSQAEAATRRGAGLVGKAALQASGKSGGRPAGTTARLQSRAEQSARAFLSAEVATEE